MFCHVYWNSEGVCIFYSGIGIYQNQTWYIIMEYSLMQPHEYKRPRVYRFFPYIFAMTQML